LSRANFHHGCWLDSWIFRDRVGVKAFNRCLQSVLGIKHAKRGSKGIHLRFWGAVYRKNRVVGGRGEKFRWGRGGGPNRPTLIRFRAGGSTVFTWPGARGTPPCSVFYYSSLLFFCHMRPSLTLIRLSYSFPLPLLLFSSLIPFSAPCLPPSNLISILSFSPSSCFHTLYHSSSSLYFSSTHSAPALTSTPFPPIPYLHQSSSVCLPFLQILLPILFSHPSLPNHHLFSPSNSPSYSILRPPFTFTPCSGASFGAQGVIFWGPHPFARLYVPF